METLTPAIFDWHTESAPYPTEVLSGDRGGVIVDGDAALVFALDALGHGPEASRTADAVRGFLERDANTGSLEEIFVRCDQQMRGTRGVALCLARIDAATDTLNWLSVGNVQAVHIRIDANGLPSYESLIMRGGVVGDRLPELRTTRTSLKPGDMLVLATDGIGHAWHRDFRAGISPRELARLMMDRHRLANDDSMVLVLRYGERDASGKRND